MEDLLIDGLFQHIISFNNYIDYARMLQVNKDFYWFVSKYTNISKFSTFMVELGISFKQEERHRLFCECCINGHFEMAKELYFMSNIDLSNIDIYASTGMYANAFKKSYLSGDLEFTKWLFSLDKKFFINKFTYPIFQKVCDSNYIDTVKWTIDVGYKSYWSNSNDDIFVLCAGKGYFELIQYLHSIWDAKPFSEKIFISSCNGGRTNIVQWIYSIKPVSKKLINKGFKSCSMNGHLELAKWLFLTNQIESSTISCVKSKMKNFVDQNHLNILEWISTLE